MRNLPLYLPLFRQKFALCTSIIVPRVVINVFQGKILLVDRVVRYPNITSQKDGNNLNDKANADPSDAETYLSLASEWNKAKIDR